MTQCHITHHDGLPACKAGHSARHMHDKRSAAAAGHFIERRGSPTTSCSYSCA